MPSGGAGRGQGRKPGSTNANQTHTREIIEQAARDGVLPLKIMFDGLRLYARDLDALIGLLVTQGAPPRPGEKAEDDSPHADVIDALKQALGIRKRMEDLAAIAAPYCHPRQGLANEGERVDDFVPLADRLAAYQRRDAIAAGGAQVVEFKPGGK